jgi:hypothetical protein
MSISSRIENMRQKPEHVRKRFAFWFSFSVASIIFIFWLASFTSLSDSLNKKISNITGQIDSPRETLVASVGNLFGDIKDIFFKKKTVRYSDIEVVPTK